MTDVHLTSSLESSNAVTLMLPRALGTEKEVDKSTMRTFTHIDTVGDTNISTYFIHLKTMKM